MSTAIAAPFRDPIPAPWQIRHGDCVKVLGSLPAGSARLLFADPPYNIGVDYGEGSRRDRLPAAQYLAWCREWIEAAAAILTPNGSMWVLISSEWADEFGCMLRRAGLHRRSWVIWYETFGVNQRRSFTRSARHLFYMVKDPKRFVFNADAVTRPSARQTKYRDKRANPLGRLWDDVWGVNPAIPRLCGTFHERLPGFPTQLPLSLLLPIVGVASDPGDLVIDPFSGSATTGVASLRLGRRYLGIERWGPFVERSRERLTGEDVEGSSA